MKKAAFIFIGILFVVVLAAAFLITYPGDMPEPLQKMRGTVMKEAMQGPSEFKEKLDREALTKVEDDMKAEGGEIIQSFMFDDFVSCRAKVDQIVAEYQRRGVKTERISDAGDLVGEKNYLIQINDADGSDLNLSCISDQKLKRAAYVQFRLRY